MLCALQRDRVALLLRQEAGDTARGGGVKHAVGTQCDAFTGFGIGHESKDLSGPGTADISAFLAFAVVVGGVQRVVLGDEQSAGMVERPVFRQVFSVLIEDL